MKRLIFFMTILSFVSNILFSQERLSVPKIWLKVIGGDSTTSLTDVRNNLSCPVPNTTFINHNASILLGDSSVYALPYETLSNDSIVTIYTAYHTESSDLIGLWEINRDTNRRMWLNSHRSSLGNTSVRYRKTTERGGIVNMIRTEYADKLMDTVYSEDGSFTLVSDTITTDTLYIGRSGEDYMDGSFIEWLYFEGVLTEDEQHKWETYLGIKSGARLKNIYVSSEGDTLWHTPLDSLYSVGIGGIGRDDSMTLYQRRSTIFGDNLTIEISDSIFNLSYILWGHNGMFEEPMVEMDNHYFIDTLAIHPFGKAWKLRTHGNGVVPGLRMTYKYPLFVHPATLRLVVNMEDSIIYNGSSFVYSPVDVTDSTVSFEVLELSQNNSYYLRMVAVGDSIYRAVRQKSDILSDTEEGIGSFMAWVTPNPSHSGDFLFEVRQAEPSVMRITITDSQGKIVYSDELEEEQRYYSLQHRIDIQGVYLITVTTPEHKKSVKLLITK